LSLLADLLDDDASVAGLSEAFERDVVAHLPHRSWTMTDLDFAALAPLAGAMAAAAERRLAGEDDRGDGAGGAAFGDMPVETS
jgi:ribosomal protein S12 methylthiotransferase accessory factor YcaO